MGEEKGTFFTLDVNTVQQNPSVTIRESQKRVLWFFEALSVALNEESQKGNCDFNYIHDMMT